MVNFGVDPANLPPDRKFLGYLNDWHYRELSAQAHLSFFGMTTLGALVSRRDAPEEKREIIENKFYPQHRAVQVARPAILLLTLISELELYFSFGLSPRILEIWQVLASSVGSDAQEIFKFAVCRLLVYENSASQHGTVNSGNDNNGRSMLLFARATRKVVGSSLSKLCRLRILSGGQRNAGSEGRFRRE